MTMLSIWLLLAGCVDDQGPDPCAAMCVAAEQLYGGCLESWSVDWSAAGYQDGDDFLDACDTWAWEMRLLEEAAGESGTVDATCEAREASFIEGPCEAFTETSWNDYPWDPEPEEDTGR